MAARRRLFARVDAMKLKETLGRVHANARNLSTGGSSQMKSLVSLIMAHGCRSGPSTPKIQGPVGVPEVSDRRVPRAQTHGVLALTIPSERRVF